MDPSSETLTLSGPTMAQLRRPSAEGSLRQNADDHLSYAPSMGTRASFDQGPNPAFDPAFAQAEECLSFLPPVSPFALLDDSSKTVDVLLSAQLAGLFSREGQLSDYMTAEQGGTVPYSSPVLICYRRNRISIAGHLALPRGLRCVLTQSGQHLPILSQEIILSAFESHENGYGGRLVQTLVQRDGPSSSAAADLDADGIAPQPIPLTPEGAEEATYDQEYTIYPFEWKKLQFRRATVNNGKGAERQRFFFVSVKILATLSDGQKVSICEVTSNSIIVRGRGPQNFAKGIGSPEHGKVYRSKTLNATLDGRLRKPDRRNTRNSLLRQSLSRKSPYIVGVSSAALQSMAAYDASTIASGPNSGRATPITPPVTPFPPAAVNLNVEPTSPSDHVFRSSSSPEDNFRMPPAVAASSRRTSQEPVSTKGELVEMYKQSFNLPTTGLQIRAPMSPPHPDNAYRTPFGFMPPFSNGEDMRKSSAGSDFAASAALADTVGMSSESPPFPPNTPRSQSHEADLSRTTTTTTTSIAAPHHATPMELAFMEQHSYHQAPQYVTMSEVSSARSSMVNFAMDNSLGVSYAPAQDASAWQHPSSMSQDPHTTWPFG